MQIYCCVFIFSSFQEWANAMARRPSSVRLSVCLSVRLSVNFCANRFFSQANGRIATKLLQDGLQVSVHPGCAQGQGQGQRSRDTRVRMSYWRSGYPRGYVWFRRVRLQDAQLLLRALHVRFPPTNHYNHVWKHAIANANDVCLNVQCNCKVGAVCR